MHGDEIDSCSRLMTSLIYASLVWSYSSVMCSAPFKIDHGPSHMMLSAPDSVNFHIYSTPLNGYTDI